MSPPSTRGFRWTTGSAIDRSLSGRVAGFDWSGNRPGPTVEVPTTGKVIISTHITLDGVWVNPAVWGSGDRAFHGRQVRMRLIATTAFDSGVVLLSYRPIPNAQASATT